MNKLDIADTMYSKMHWQHSQKIQEIFRARGINPPYKAEQYGVYYETYDNALESGQIELLESLVTSYAKQFEDWRKSGSPTIEWKPNATYIIKLR